MRPRILIQRENAVPGSSSSTSFASASRDAAACAGVTMRFTA